MNLSTFEIRGNLLKQTRKIFELEEMCENEKRMICGELSFSASIQSDLKTFFDCLKDKEQ
jgi:hypothetical protein